MPPSLRQHVAEAEKILSIAGVRTLIPQKGLPAPVKVDAGNRQMEYAISIRVVVWRHDRTGWAASWLAASDDVAGEVWRSIPEWPVCPLCMGRAQHDHGKGRICCQACGAFIKPKNLKGIVSADLRSMRRALREGEIRCE